MIQTFGVSAEQSRIVGIGFGCDHPSLRPAFLDPKRERSDVRADIENPAKSMPRGDERLQLVLVLFEIALVTAMSQYLPGAVFLTQS